MVVLADFRKLLEVCVLAGLLLLPVHTANVAATEELWEFGTGGNILDLKPVVDVNGDGYSDVLVGSADNNVYVVDGHPGAPERKLWSRLHADGDIISVDSIDDITFDGIREVVAGCAEGKQVYCHNGATGNEIWNRMVEEAVYRIQSIDDISGDGVSDVLVGWSLVAGSSGKSGVSCLSGYTGQFLWNKTYSGYDSQWNDFAGIADVTGDGKCDVVVSYYRYYMDLLDGTNGNIVKHRGDLPYVDWGGFVRPVPDISGDGYQELLNLRVNVNSISGAKVLLISSATIETIWERTWSAYYANERLWDAGAISDATGDGRMDVVVGWKDQVYCLDGIDGNKPLVWSKSIGINTNHLRSWRIASDQDISGDGVSDLIVGAEDSKVYILNGTNGSTLQPEYSTSGAVGVVSYMPDVSDDLLCEILAGSNNNIVYCLAPPTIEVRYAHLVVKGDDNGIYYRNFDGASWSSWEGIPGSTDLSPAAAVYGGKLHVVVHGIGGGLFWGSVSRTGDFSGWTPILGDTQSAPTLAASASKLCLVVRGMDNGIYYKVYDGSSWNEWNSVPGATIDRPAAALVFNDNLHLCVRGVGGGLWYATKNLVTAVWSGWTPVPGDTPSAPTLASHSSKTYLVLRGMDNQVWYNIREGSTWSSWSAMLFPGGTSMSPAVTAYGGKLQAIVIDLTYRLWRSTIDLTTNAWSNAWHLTSGSTSSAPILAS